MWIVEIALKRPYTFIVLALLIILATPFVLFATPTDIFPEINIPVLSIIWNYNGLSPKEMSDRIVSVNERGLTTTVNDIEHIESQSLTGVGVVKVFFQPGANIPTALAQVVSMTQAQLRQMPAGQTPPLVIKYSASSIPILQLGLSSPTLSEQELNDVGLNQLRTRLITVPGVAIPYPYGGKLRLISVDLDTSALLAHGISPSQVVSAIGTQNLILPSGTQKIGNTEYDVALNGTPETIALLNAIPIKTTGGATVYLRDVAHVRDGYQPQTNIVRKDGQRGALLSVIKNGNTSTLAIVSDILHRLPILAQSMPKEFKVTPLFDQSLFVKAAISGV
ncbi:MAG: efflux RND transporter permease subunit, partial [Burkholderiales bacterium]|nr:efflux RND transporter permease subunit [Burkholderiales bacterium]